MSRFETAVERHAKGRTPWLTITVTLWQHDLPRAFQLLQSGENPATSFKEAVERACRHESAGLTGGAAAISAISFMPVSSRTVVLEFLSPKRQQRQQGRQQGSRQQPRQRGIQQVNSQAQVAKGTPRSHCTYDICDKQVGHWESTCLQKARDMWSRRANDHVSKRHRSTPPPRQLSPFPSPPPRRRRRYRRRR